MGSCAKAGSPRPGPDSRVDAVVVLVSGYTSIVKDVGDEVQIAHELGKPILAIRTDEEAEPLAGVTELHGWDELRDLSAR